MNELMEMYGSDKKFFSVTCMGCSEILPGVYNLKQIDEGKAPFCPCGNKRYRLLRVPGDEKTILN